MNKTTEKGKNNYTKKTAKFRKTEQDTIHEQNERGRDRQKIKSVLPS